MVRIRSFSLIIIIPLLMIDQQLSNVPVHAAAFTFAHCDCADETGNYTQGSTYEHNLNLLLSNLSSLPSHFKFYNLTVGQSPYKVYALFQCRDDMVPEDCRECIKSATERIVQLCPLYNGAAFWSYECMLRYSNRCLFALQESSAADVYKSVAKFGNADRQVRTLMAKTTVDQGKGGLKLSVILEIAIPATVGLIGLILFGFYRWWLHPNKGEDIDIDTKFVRYDHAMLRDATNNFSPSNKIGERGLGVVYRGVLKSGEEVAIKLLSQELSMSNTSLLLTYQRLAKLQHKNLVTLHGFSCERHKQILVYDFMPNASIDLFLRDKIKRGMLRWEIRYKIILGIAAGLKYLHEDCDPMILVRNLKSSNILLDPDMNPKISDVGFQAIFDDANVGSSSYVRTYGYLAPEYMMTGDFSERSDTYSFGMLILEILTGSDFRLICCREDPMKLWSEGRLLDIMDPMLNGRCTEDDAIRCIKVGLVCAQVDPTDRPAMSHVELMLTGSVPITLPTKP